MAHIVRAVTESDRSLKGAVNDSIITVEKLFSNAKHIDEFTAIMRKAVQFAETEEDDLNAIHQLGEGWVAEETLAIAVYCALKLIRQSELQSIITVIAIPPERFVEISSVHILDIPIYHRNIRRIWNYMT